MKKMFPLMMAAAILAAPLTATVAFADEMAAPAVEAEAAADAVVATEFTLVDGTTGVIEGDKVFVNAADGSRVAAPDGEHTLADGTTVTTKDGVLVTPAAE
jgi:hypothetical protein